MFLCKIQDIYIEFGFAYLQVGKSYPYQQGSQEVVAKAVKNIKNSIDPDNWMNPGALGL